MDDASTFRTRMEIRTSMWLSRERFLACIVVKLRGVSARVFVSNTRHGSLGKKTPTRASRKKDDEFDVFVLEDHQENRTECRVSLTAGGEISTVEVYGPHAGVLPEPSIKGIYLQPKGIRIPICIHRFFVGDTCRLFLTTRLEAFVHLRGPPNYATRSNSTASL